jgi:hypothetical protein
VKQLKVSLPDGLREHLEQASSKAGHSLSEELRLRLEKTIADEEIDPETRELMAAVGRFAALVRLQTRQEWHRHPAAHRVLRHEITARLARLKPEGEPVFLSGELPTARLVAAGSDDPEAMGLALEAVDFHRPPMTPERRRRLDELRENTYREILELHQQRSKKGEGQ